MNKSINHLSHKAFTLVEMMVVVLIIAGLLVIMFRMYKINSDYSMAHQIDEFVKAVDKGLFIANTTLQNYSFRDGSASGNEGDNGGLYLMVSDTSFNSVYNALTKGDCMVRCFDNSDNNNSQCGGNTSDFNGMCQNNDQSNTLCLMNVFDKRYIDTYMIPKMAQGKITFDTQTFNSNYQAVKDLKGNDAIILIGQLIKLNNMVIDLSSDPSIISILQNIDSRYQKRGNSIVYPLNNGAGHFVIVRSGYTCQ